MTARGYSWKPTPEQLWCRDVQHAWAPATAERTSAGYERVLGCSRCGAVKTQHLDKSGYITGSTMKYPSGYLRPGEGRLTREDRAELRLGNMDA